MRDLQKEKESNLKIAVELKARAAKIKYDLKGNSIKELIRFIYEDCQGLSKRNAMRQFSRKYKVHKDEIKKALEVERLVSESYEYEKLS